MSSSRWNLLPFRMFRGLPACAPVQVGLPVMGLVGTGQELGGLPLVPGGRSTEPPPVPGTGLEVWVAALSEINKMLSVNTVRSGE